MLAAGNVNVAIKVGPTCVIVLGAEVKPTSISDQ
jgi:hypothetical protein